MGRCRGLLNLTFSSRMRHEICGLDPRAATACSKSEKLVMLLKGTAPSSQRGAESESFVRDQWLSITSRLTARV